MWCKPNIFTSTLEKSLDLLVSIQYCAIIQYIQSSQLFFGFETDCWFAFSNQEPNTVTGICLEVCCTKKIFRKCFIFKYAQITLMLRFDHTKELEESKIALSPALPFPITCVQATRLSCEHPGSGSQLRVQLHP